MRMPLLRTDNILFHSPNNEYSEIELYGLIPTIRKTVMKNFGWIFLISCQ
jgi:hypothetical protein